MYADLMDAMEEHVMKYMNDEAYARKHNALLLRLANLEDLNEVEQLMPEMAKKLVDAMGEDPELLTFMCEHKRVSRVAYNVIRVSAQKHDLTIPDDLVVRDLPEWPEVIAHWRRQMEEEGAAAKVEQILSEHEGEMYADTVCDLMHQDFPDAFEVIKMIDDYTCFRVQGDDRMANHAKVIENDLKEEDLMERCYSPLMIPVVLALAPYDLKLFDKATSYMFPTMRNTMF